MWEASKNISILKEFVPKLVKYFDWWRTTRDANGDYLVVWIERRAITEDERILQRRRVTMEGRRGRREERWD